MLLHLIGAAQAMTIDEIWLSYEVAGFDGGDVDEVPRGGELLTAGPDDRLALYNPIDARVLLLDGDHQITALIDSAGVGSMAWDSAGRLLLYAPHRRQLILHAPDGRLLDVIALPDIIPAGGTVVVSAADAFVVDVFSNLHRAARISDDTLLPPSGPTLVEDGGRVRWDAAATTLTVDGIDWPLPEAIKASGRLVGNDWLLIDQVVAGSPIVATRTAALRETGERLHLPVDSRLYVPRADVAADADGRLLYLDPREDGLYIVRVTP